METKTPWAAEGLALSSREEKLAHFLLSRGKRQQLERLLAKARAGVSTGLTSPATGGHAHAATGASRARPLAPHNRPPPRPGKGPQRRPPSVAYAARRGPEQAPVKVPVTATARAPDPPVLPPPPPRKETPSPPDEASPGETPSPANVTLRRRGRAGPVPPTPQGATPPQAPPTLVREATPPQASPVAATATPPPLRDATPPQASPSAPTPVRNATPPAAPTPVAAAPATVSPIYRDTALIAADDEACERALTNWLRAPGLAADASAQEWRDAWRVAAAAADVALQKAVQVDQQRMRVLNDYETFRAGAANLATRAARDAHAELETAKARVSALEASLVRYQASYPPPVGDEAVSDDAHDGSALPATEAMPRAQPDVAPAEPAAAPHARPDVLAPTPRPGRARLTTVATPAPRPRRYATRSSRRGRAG